MTHDDTSASGLWTLVILSSLVFIVFAFSFGKPRSPNDWRSFSAFSAFIVALRDTIPGVAGASPVFRIATPRVLGWIRGCQ